MKRKGQIKKFFSVLMILFIFGACKKTPQIEPDLALQLPELTQEGKNTAGCYLNNEIFVANVEPNTGGAIALWASFDEVTNFFRMQATMETANDRLESIKMKSYLTDTIGTYPIFLNEGEEYEGYVDYSGANCYYLHDENNLGMIEIKFIDKEQNIISGLFSMDLINTDCSSNAVLKITGGRFDIKY
ncbi:MAG: hypothetical protein GQ574_22250 [Crocinitomix sp.]|nr:hypothetical protein [Crocinitomix sp.]